MAHHGRIPNAIIALPSPAPALLSLRASINSFRRRSFHGPGVPDYIHGSAGCDGLATPGRPRSDMQRPAVHHGDVVFERALGSNTGLSASYLFTAGRHLPTFVDVDLPAPTARAYTIVGGEFDGETVTVSPLLPARVPTRDSASSRRFGASSSRSMQASVLQLTRRLTNGLQFDTSYTLSKATDNGQSS